jgi:hypothetical protein
MPFFFTTIPGIVKTEENKKSTGNIAKQVRFSAFNFSLYPQNTYILFKYRVSEFTSSSVPMENSWFPSTWVVRSCTFSKGRKFLLESTLLDAPGSNHDPGTTRVRVSKID